MRKMLAVMATAAFIAGTSLYAAEMTVKGEVVDVACQVKKAPGGQGEAHKGCADA